MQKIKCGCTLSFVLALHFASNSLAQSYKFHDLYALGSPQVGFNTTFGIGPGGVATGYDPQTHYPVVWSPAHPNGITLSQQNGEAYGTDGTSQVGSAAGGATIWSGASESAVSLNPYDVVGGVKVPWYGSAALAVKGGQQVGWAVHDVSANNHAALWSGTADSFVDLKPAGFDYSVALGVGGGQQVGWGYGSAGAEALLWSGSVSTFVSLNPSGAVESYAFGTDGHHQVGYALTDIGAEAYFWSGTAQSAVDLGPGVALSVAGSKQLGLNFDEQLTVWNGSSGSAVNLSPLLPTSYSIDIPSGGFGDDLCFDDNGNIFGIAQDLNYQFRVFELEAVSPDGDFNNDGKVDVRDYVVWRNGLGTTYTNVDYNVWRVNYGRVISGGTSFSPASIPEPPGLLLLTVALIGLGVPRNALRH